MHFLVLENNEPDASSSDSDFKVFPASTLINQRMDQYLVGEIFNLIDLLLNELLSN